MQSDQELILQFQKSIQREQTFTQLVKKTPGKSLPSNKTNGQ